jgi:nicotinate-nucleotide pyrophosphorylase (carboxylating)
MPALFIEESVWYRNPVDWHNAQIRKLISLALLEDRANDDVTTRTLIGARWKAKAEIRSKQSGVVAGLPLAAAFFKAVSPRLRFRPLVPDGAKVKSGQALARIEGSARAILGGERPALNALQHLSGIATYTAQQVKRLGHSRTGLFDTRKTIPGWRLLEKYAVLCGGGKNHRLSLADAMLIKENHLKLARAARFPWVRRIQHFRKMRPRFPVQIEIQTESDLKEAILAKPQRVLLDNMSPARLRRTIVLLRKQLPKCEIEISGGVRADQLARLSKLGVERISMGRLTHSAPAFDCSLDFLELKI